MMAKNPQVSSSNPTFSTSNPQVSAGQPADFGIGTAYEPVFNPAREAAHRAAMQEYSIRQNPAGYVRLPNGAAVRIQPGIAPGYPGEKAGKMLGDPAGMLMHPKPPFASGARYQWRVRVALDPRDNRAAETANLIRAGKIRFIAPAEVNPYCDFAVYTDVNDAVTYQSQVLCEILDERISYEAYKAWDDLAIHRQRGLPADLREAPSVLAESGAMVPTHVPGKTATEMHITDVRQGG